jgi:putative iron-dependent peroxidase
MSQEQSGILPEPEESALFLVLRLADRARDAAHAAKAAARIPAKLAALSKREPRRRLVGTVAFGPALWDLLSPAQRPATLRPFPALPPRAPSTGGDLLLHVAATRIDVCFEIACALRRELGDAAEVLEEVHGFRYLEGRDLTGFIDGTENPTGRGRAEAALIGPEDRAFAGGAYVFTQRYVHDLARWTQLSTKEQEAVIGRRKRDSVELSDRAKPATAHIARVVIEENGEELEILRRSYPYGTTSEHGLFFLAYTRNLAIPEKMLRRMFDSEGPRDQLMEFTRAVSGANFFAPSLPVLRKLAKR